MRLEMIVEWSLGSPLRFDWDGQRLVPFNPPWQPERGLPPVNYGQIPHYFNPADQAALDAIWASQEPVAVGTRLEGEVLGMVWVKDGDHKIILGQPGSLETLDYEGLYTWFAGREPRFTTAEEAIHFILSL
jgi:inorganic pyrophosphatase